MCACIYALYTHAELYTNVRFLSLEDKPRVPEGEYDKSDIEEAITYHWTWMMDSFKVDSPL